LATRATRVSAFDSESGDDHCSDSGLACVCVWACVFKLQVVAACSLIRTAPDADAAVSVMQRAATRPVSSAATASDRSRRVTASSRARHRSAAVATTTICGALPATRPSRTATLAARRRRLCQRQLHPQTHATLVYAAQLSSAVRCRRRAEVQRATVDVQAPHARCIRRSGIRARFIHGVVRRVHNVRAT
jgi:hypothetical protein